MRALLAEDVLLSYPDATKPFHIYTDASDYQLGAVIMQNNRSVAFYSRKLSSAQMKYTVMEKELLSIVETLHAYRSMLYGCELHVHTDHKNLTYTKLNSRRVLRWRLLLEDFHPTFHYIKGSHSAIADSLSRLDITPHSSLSGSSKHGVQKA
jgi:RNase H-like domain found in reverse transcriptase